MRKIVAIGGGEIGRPGSPAETTEIDKRIIELTGKKNPRLLFIPTASSDSKDYLKRVEDHFGVYLGCQTDVLYLLNSKIDDKTIREKILNSDIVYVGGGNTLKMMKVWKNHGLDEILKEAHDKGIVLSGISAGAICWFKQGNSDSRKFANPEADFIKVTGLGLIDALHCPHYDLESDRKPKLKKMMSKTTGVSIAVDDCCALEIVDDNYRVICTKPTANVYKTYWKAGEYYEEVVEKAAAPKALSDLLQV